MSALAALLVSFNVSPTLREPGAPPRLVVTLKNPSADPIALMRFESDACFAHFFLELPLTLPDGSKAEPAPCPIRAWPGTKGTLAAGAHEERTLDLARIFPGVKWVRGRYSLPARWNPKQLQAHFDGEYATRASQSSLNQDFFELAPSQKKVRVERGQDVELADGAHFVFNAHGHKRTKVGGPPSPLIIHGTFAPPKQKPETFEVHVFTDESRLFELADGYTFELVRHEYGAWMELVYFGKR